jgi:hypothetical protein
MICPSRRPPAASHRTASHRLASAPLPPPPEAAVQESGRVVCLTSGRPTEPITSQRICGAAALDSLFHAPLSLLALPRLLLAGMLQCGAFCSVMLCCVVKAGVEIACGCWPCRYMNACDESSRLSWRDEMNK